MKTWTSLETKGCYFPFTVAAEEVQISTRCTDRVAGHKTTACFTIHKYTHKYRHKYIHKYRHKYRNKYSYTNVCKYKCGYKRCTDEALELKPLPELTLGIQHCTNSIRRTPSQFILESTVFSSTHTNSAKNSPVGVSGTK